MIFYIHNAVKLKAFKYKKLFHEDGQQEGRDWTCRDPVRSWYCNGLVKNHLHMPFLSLCFGKNYIWKALVISAESGYPLPIYTIVMGTDNPLLRPQIEGGGGQQEQNA